MSVADVPVPGVAPNEVVDHLVNQVVDQDAAAVDLPRHFHDLTGAVRA